MSAPGVSGICMAYIPAPNGVTSFGGPSPCFFRFNETNCKMPVALTPASCPAPFSPVSSSAGAASAAAPLTMDPERLCSKTDVEAIAYYTSLCSSHKQLDMCSKLPGCQWCGGACIGSMGPECHLFDPATRSNTTFRAKMCPTRTQPLETVRAAYTCSQATFMAILCKGMGVSTGAECSRAGCRWCGVEDMTNCKAAADGSCNCPPGPPPASSGVCINPDYKDGCEISVVQTVPSAEGGACYPAMTARFAGNGRCSDQIVNGKYFKPNGASQPRGVSIVLLAACLLLAIFLALN